MHLTFLKFREFLIFFSDVGLEIGKKEFSKFFINKKHGGSCLISNVILIHADCMRIVGHLRVCMRKKYPATHNVQ